MNDVETVRDARLARFARLEKQAGGGAPWLRDLRRRALARFQVTGFPSLRQEEWRKTDVSRLARSTFVPAAEAARPAAGAGLAPLLLPDAAARLVFVNGRWAPEHSSLGALPAGVRLQPLAAVLRDNGALEPHLGRHASFEEQPFTALNTALFEDGAFLHLGPGTQVEAPIQVVFWTEPGAQPIESHPRLLVLAEDGSQARLVEVHAGAGGTYFTNAVAEIVLGPGAGLEHVRIQSEALAAFHIGGSLATLGRDARYVSHALALGGGLVRHEGGVVFTDEGGDCTLNGLYLLAGEQHSDNRTSVDHARPHCTSRQLFKGILTGAARGVFNGRIVVRPDAQKTDARQANRNLLLSEAALVDTKPQLEIYADDVRCTHGATIGRLQDEAVFYLRSRGIGADQARALLVRAFALDVVGRIGIASVRAQLEARLDERLAHLSTSEATP